MSLNSYDNLKCSEFSDEYMKISELEIEEIHDKGNSKESVFQVQSKKGSKFGIIMEVGKFNEVKDVEINSFNLSPKIKCVIISSIFNLEQLLELSQNSSFNMIKIISYHKNKSKFIKLSYLEFNFNFSDHIIEKKEILQYISNGKQQNILEGFFTINYHFDNKSIMLEKFINFIGIEEAIDKMISYLISDYVKEINDNLLRNIN